MDAAPLDVLGCGAILIDRVRHVRNGAMADEIVQWGGAAGNTLALLAAAGMRTALIGAVGADKEAFVRQAMRTFGVLDELLVVQPDRLTPTVMIRIEVSDPLGRTERIQCLGIEPRTQRAQLRRKDLMAAHSEALERARLFHGDTADAPTIALAQAARLEGVPVSFDLPRFRPAALTDVRRMLAQCDLFFTNAFSSRQHLEAFEARDLFAVAPELRLVVVTRGLEGADAWTGPRDGRRHVHVEAVPPRTFADSLGAGDAFIATILRDVFAHDLLPHLAEPDVLEESMRRAARLGAQACQHAGAKGLARHLAAWVTP